MNKEITINRPAWEQVARFGDRLPHALLLNGPAGVGKSHFAERLAKGLLCEDRGEGLAACGACPSCRWFDAGSHPDFRRICPESDSESEEEAPESGARKRGSTQIKIDQIRALEDFAFVGSHRGTARVILVEPAEAMNAAAANALLKLLEEPPATVYFILVSSRWRRLLPTIRSRCRALNFSRPSPAESRAWLEANGHRSAIDFLDFAGGAPVLAITEAQRGDAIKAFLDTLADPGRDPLSLAGRWETQLKGETGSLTMEDAVTIFLKWLFDLVSCKLGAPMRFAAQKADQAAKLVARSEVLGLIRCYNDFLKLRALAGHPLNPRLFLEEAAERYLRALHKP